MPLIHDLPLQELPGLDDPGHFFAVDCWSGDLSTGLFQLEETTRQVLGLTSRGCFGLLSLVRCFEPGDQPRLIETFEHAAAEPGRFSFASLIAGHGKIGQPVYCIGRSTGRDGEALRLAGVFIFPHL